MKQKIYICIALMVFFFLTGCGGDDTSQSVPTPSPVTISGTIIDEASQPITVPVIVTASNGNSLTTSTGSFTIQVNPNANYILSVKADGYNGALTGGGIGSTSISDLQIRLNSNNRPVVQFRNN
jgi:hypothetical protein